MSKARAPRKLKALLPAAATKNLSVWTRTIKRSQTPAEATAELVVEGIAGNVMVLAKSSRKLGALDLTATAEGVYEASRNAASGNLSALEAILSAQALALNAIFTDCVMRAADNTPHSFEIHERLMRMAFRAQGQCRATVESLSVIQNPPVFAKNLQANIAANQQVNNGGADSRARASKTQSAPNKLMDGSTHVERIKRVDTGTTSATTPGNSPLATVEALDRAAYARRQSDGRKKRRQGPAAAAAPRRIADARATAKDIR